MLTMIVYDNTGSVLYSTVYDEQVRKPSGVPYIIIDLPDGMIVESVDIATQRPIYKKDTIIVSELNRLSAKVDYVAMMSGLEVTGAVDDDQHIDVIEGHSLEYYRVQKHYLEGVWGINTVKNAINRWITSDEYNQIIKLKEDQNTIDTEHEIPRVSL